MNTADADLDTWVYLVGSLAARPVKIGTAANAAARLRDLQCGSPVQLHIMWQTRGGRALELTLHQRFAGYRTHGEWFDFGDDHPVAIVATAAVELGYRCFPSGDLLDTSTLPVLPQVAEARRLVAWMREAFSRAGDPETMTLAEIVDYLSAVDPDTWRQWDDRWDRLSMAGRTMATTFKAARIDLASTRLQRPGRPTGYKLLDVARAALIGTQRRGERVD